MPHKWGMFLNLIEGGQNLAFLAGRGHSLLQATAHGCHRAAKRLLGAFLSGLTGSLAGTLAGTLAGSLRCATGSLGASATLLAGCTTDGCHLTSAINLFLQDRLEAL